MKNAVRKPGKGWHNPGKTVLVLGLSLVLVLAFRSVAMAATNGPHGSFTTNTASCAQCHRTHTAPSSHLIAFPLVSGTQNDVYRTCIYCHSATGSSHYDEVDGQIKDGTNLWATSAGGFQNMPVIEGGTSDASVVAVTSKHQVDQPNGALVTIPGGSTNAGGKIQLTCESCHDPHGTANARQLVTSVTVFNTAGTGWTSVNTTPTGQTISMTVNNPTTNESVTYNDDNLNTFCGACHTDYYQTAAGSGSAQSGTYTTGLYRHRIGMPASGASGFNATYFALPTSGSGDVLCVTCHYAHGTTVTVSSSTYSGGATLLRMDERGVCQNCHRKTFSTSQPAVLGAPNSYQISVDKTRVVVAYNSYMEKNSVQNPANYTVTGGLTVTGAALQVNGVLGKTVLLTLSGTPAAGTSYTITVNTANVQDLNGHTVSASGNTFTFTGQ